MAIWLPERDVWTRQPIGALRVSPLWGDRVVFACIPGVSFSDVVSGQRATVLGSIQVNGSSQGLVAKANSTFNRRLSWGSLRPIANMTDGYSMLLFAYCVTRADHARAMLLGDELSAGSVYNQSTIGINANDSAANASSTIAHWEYNTGSFRACSDTGVVPFNQWYVIIVTRPPGTSVASALYLNGINKTVNTTSNAGVAFNSGVHLLGGVATTNRCMIDDVALAAVFNKQLNDAEVRTLSRNPWQLFE